MSCASSQEDLRTNNESLQSQMVSMDLTTNSTMYDEPKQTPKVIRVLTVIGYILAVSMAAIMLSLYYILMWNPPDIVDVNKTNSYEMMNQEALAQIKADVSSLGTAPSAGPAGASWQTTTEDSSESVYDEASSETKIDESNLLLSNLDDSMLSYESDVAVNNNTSYK